jgi:hypothetical protein
LPLCTCDAIRSLIFDLSSEGECRDEPPLDASLFSAVSILLSALLNALWSDELIVPADTSDASSLCKRSSGELDEGW